MFKNKNNDDNKLKSLKRSQILVISLLGIFVLVLVTFGILIILPTTDTTTPETPFTQPVYITPTTEITVIEKCIHCTNQRDIINQELADEIRRNGHMIQQDLKGFLVSRLNLDSDYDPIKLFTTKEVIIQYEIEQCDLCKDEDYVFMVYENEQLSFYQGLPEKNNIIKTISEEVLFIDKEKEEEYSQGIKMGEEIFYIGIYENSFGVYLSEPVNGQDPLFIFTNLTVRSDLHFILIDEKPKFTNYEEMLDLIEAYAGNH
ncbi:hypothetical protein HYG86_13580 [Alkalicella caledoniensis]|uniref:Uncharacterized protein n=1 Tax=Alkalicella caledoniensis TaxID=2731377 RepID=A0A7G9WAK7_ALKCA|nr:hypothetical protein [Alkalicella caledoniensis]QNO15719.1 hypothetical protein HYG86_13580 [Alkalicella caledoniensis]